MKKNGFTLIELLAVIIILAIVALISTPIILNVVDEARESANKSSVAMYADAVKLAVIDEYFENQSYPIIDVTWANNNVEYGGEKITCEAIFYTETEGVTLNECTIGGQAFNYIDDMSVSAEDTVYCYTKGKVYTDCLDEEYQTYYIAVSQGTPATSNVAYDNAEGVNVPQLLTGMTPVKYNGTNWAMADTNEDWYDYSTKQWANVVVLNEGVTKSVGDTIDVNTEVSLMYVWIPRYAYMIGSGYHTSTASEISVEFLKDDTINNDHGTVVETTGYVSGSNDTSTNYFLHPAFENADTKYGFWVAKFEASGTSDNITIKPGVSSLRSIMIGDMFDASIAMKTKAPYGFNASETESHMMTNYEWGAVAYLTQSKFGRCESGTCTEVTINANNSFYTGGGTGGAYKTNVGQSTTGNVTGIYDMSGGAYEYVAAYVDNGNGNINTYGNSIVNSTSEYKNVYTVTSDSQANNYEVNKNIYGDALYETSSLGTTTGGSWYNDCSYMPNVSSPWFVRGSYYNAGSAIAGVFSFYLYNGNYQNLCGFRPVIVKIQS